jgi:PPOX class probable F420-dependent enzyme
MRSAATRSRLALVPLPEDETQRLLRSWPVARLATLAPGGRPHVVPIVFAWHAGAVWSPVDGKPKRGGPLARVRHLESEPRVSVLLDHYETDWRRLWWIRVDGRAALVAGDGAAEAALRAKYPQYGEGVALYAGPPALIRIEPERVTSWSAERAGGLALSSARP